jgi:hypothetical protein
LSKVIRLVRISDRSSGTCGRKLEVARARILAERSRDSQVGACKWAGRGP